MANIEILSGISDKIVGKWQVLVTKSILRSNHRFLKTGTHVVCDSSKVHAKGFCSAPLRRVATCGNVFVCRNLRVFLRWSDAVEILKHEPWNYHKKMFLIFRKNGWNEVSISPK